MGVRKLRNGGVVYELNTPVVAAWLRQAKASFMEKFGGMSIVKEKMVSVMVEYVPVAHAPDALAENRRIEQDSRLEVEDLLTTRWIKPEQRQAPGQKVAHLIACFRTKEAVNQAIHEGLVITGRRVWARRLQREPKRCLKCQSLNTNHFAVECNHLNVCSTCGKEHKTADCDELDSEKFWCINCKALGHASWDQLCPKFLEVSRKLAANDPEHMYRFFPSHKPWTWEQAPTDQELCGSGWRNTSGGNPQEGRDWMTNETGASTARAGNERLRAYDSRRPATQIGPPDQGWSQMAHRQQRLDEFPQGRAQGGTQER